ncbi:MAG: hypothetical protein Ta2A_22010 [Treponemataceae bacterium]|nr:MAG: hypothetical protein Ta2A_22010 [Treponemataceae bacterium]
MAKELIEYNGKFYFFDDQTGDVNEVIIKNRNDDPEVLRNVVLQVIRLKEKQNRQQCA